MNISTPATTTTTTELRDYLSDEQREHYDRIALCYAGHHALRITGHRVADLLSRISITQALSPMRLCGASLLLLPPEHGMYWRLDQRPDLLLRRCRRALRTRLREWGQLDAYTALIAEIERLDDLLRADADRAIDVEDDAVTRVGILDAITSASSPDDLWQRLSELYPS